jgi:2-amino-4-hydroxy-6-hydroxymethyldihydropteridine diphosphokinase
MGDRAAALRHAQSRLSNVTGYRCYAVSDIYETTPLGGPEQSDYLNQVVVLQPADPLDVAEPDYRAEALLAVCHSIERDLGRVRQERWGPRTLDVDILAMGAYVSDEPELTIPHPRLADRAFVLVPWAQIDPDFPVPGLGIVRQLLAKVSASERKSVWRYRP